MRSTLQINWTRIADLSCFKPISGLRQSQQAEVIQSARYAAYAYPYSRLVYLRELRTLGFVLII